MEKKVVKVMHSPAHPRVEVVCGVALTVVPPYLPRTVNVQVVRHRTDTVESRQSMRTRQMPDTVTVTLELATRPEAPVFFDDWKTTVRLLGVTEASATDDPGARVYEFQVTGAAPRSKDDEGMA